MNIILIILIVCSLGIQVKAGLECELAFQKYYECKHLKMRQTDSGRYEVDTSIPNNVLNESFYNSTLGSATFDTAMDLQRDIYFSVTNLSCSTELCRCARAAGIDYIAEARVGFVFRDENVYSQFKKNIIGFKNKLDKEHSIWKHSDYPRMFENFCIDYDILAGNQDAGILSDYLNYVPCIALGEDESNFEENDREFYDCFLPYMDEINYRFFKEAGHLKLNKKADNDRLVVCIAKTIDFDKTCTQDEKDFIMSIYMLRFKNLFEGETNLTAFVESMSRKVAEKQISVRRNKTATITEGYYYKVKTFNRTVFNEIPEGQNVNLFNSAMFNVTAHLEKRKITDKGYEKFYLDLKSITIHSIFDWPTSQYLFNRTFDIYPQSNLSSDCSILNPFDQSEKIWIRAISFKYNLPTYNKVDLFFIDFKWNVSIDIKDLEFKIVMPDNLVSQAQGGLLFASNNL